MMWWTRINDALALGASVLGVLGAIVSLCYVLRQCYYAGLGLSSLRVQMALATAAILLGASLILAYFWLRGHYAAAHGLAADSVSGSIFFTGAVMLMMVGAGAMVRAVTRDEHHNRLWGSCVGGTIIVMVFAWWMV